MKKVRKILSLLAILMFVIVYGQAIAFAEDAPPLLESPFGEGDIPDDDDDGPPSLGTGEGDEDDDGPPSLGTGEGDDTSDGTGDDTSDGTGDDTSGTGDDAGDDTTGTIGDETPDSGTTGADTGYDTNGTETTNKVSETGPEVAVLLFPTLALSTSYFFYRRRKEQK